jgi:aspartyl-tRNA(Asn)/glutamyl-tRNA(Gln) amidotransferase subunit C
MTMTKLSGDVVKKVAHLAKLNLNETEIAQFQKQLGEVISYFDVIKSVNTKSVEPTSQTTGLLNVFRKDALKLENCLSQKDALAGSDRNHNGYFVVDAILSERSDK